MSTKRKRLPAVTFGEITADGAIYKRITSPLLIIAHFQSGCKPFRYNLEVNFYEQLRN